MSPEPETAVLYRYVDCKNDDEGGGPPKLVLVTYPILRETPKCWVIDTVGGSTKRVLKGAGKRFAHETVDWAAKSWRRRKRFQAMHLRHQLQHVEDCLSYDLAALPRPEEKIPGVYSPKITSDHLIEFAGGVTELHHWMPRQDAPPPLLDDPQPLVRTDIA